MLRRYYLFEAALDLYVEKHLALKIKAHRVEAERLLRRHFTFKTLDEINRKSIVPILDELTPSIRDHALRRLKAFLNWCVDRDYLSQNALVRLKSGVATTKRDRVLSDDEIRRIWAASAQMGQYGAIIRLCVLSGQRKGQIAALQKDWVKDDLIMFPASVMKSGVEHVLPIGTLCAELIASWRDHIPHSPLFFASGRSTLFTAWSKNKRKLDRLSNTSGWVVHDLRRYFRSSLSRWKCCTPDIAERLIGHRVGSDVANIYDRYHYLPEKRAALEAYEAYLQRLFNQSSL